MPKKFVATIGSQLYEISTFNGSVLVNGERVNADLVEIGDGLYSLILDGKVYTIGSLREAGEKADLTSKSSSRTHITINNHDYTVVLDDKRSLLLKSLMKEKEAGSTVMTIRAPMPGLIVKVEVEEGERIQQGQGLIILEAMKMENEIKALSHGTIKTIHVQPHKAVEKGEALISLIQT